MAQRTLYVSILGFFIARLYLALSFPGMWGVDGGAYELSALRVLGHEFTGTDFIRPPFAPGFLLVPFVSLFGSDIGLKLFSVACTMVILPSFYLFMSLWLKGWGRTIAMIMFMADWQLAEMWTAGALPMIGFSFMLLIIWAVLRKRGPREFGLERYIFACVPTLVALTNQTSVGVSIFLIGASLISLLVEGRKDELLTDIKWLALGGIIAAAITFHWYIDVAPESEGLRYPGAMLTIYSWSNTAWWMAGYGVLTAGALFWTQHKPLYPLACILITISIMRVFLSHDETVMNILYRSGYLLTPLCVIAWIWLVKRYVPAFQWSYKWPKVALTIIILTATTGWWFQVKIMRVIEQQVTPDTQQAIAWLNKQTYDGKVLTNSYSMSLYVASLTQHQTAWSQVYDPPIKYRQQHNDVICIFGWDDSCDVQNAIDRQQGSYLLIDRRWPADTSGVDNFVGLPGFYKNVKTLSLQKTYAYGLVWGQVDNPWSLTDASPWLTKVWEHGNTIIYKVNRA